MTRIELNTEAVEDARENKQLNGINNAVSHAMLAEKLPGHKSNDGKLYGAVILNSFTRDVLNPVCAGDCPACRHVPPCGACGVRSIDVKGKKSSVKKALI